MPWVQPSSENLVQHARVLVWAGGRGKKREGHISGTRAGQVRVTYLTMEWGSGTWMPISRVISVEVEDPQLELEI